MNKIEGLVGGHAENATEQGRELTMQASANRHDGKRIVLAHGVFDVLHEGHLAHFREAKQYGDYLVVSVTADAWVNKGPGRPVFPQDVRMAMLRELRIVDEVVLCDHPTALPSIEVLRPSVYAKGSEYAEASLDGARNAERAAVEAYGGQVVYTDTSRAVTSSTLIKREFINPGSELAAFQKHVAQIGLTMRDVDSYLGLARTMQAVVLGEPIYDEYVYVHPAGKSPKENLITFRRNGKSEVYRGGVWAVAANQQAIVEHVRIETGGMKPVRKRRYVEAAFTAKVFSEAIEPPVVKPHIPTDLDASDLVTVVDYGHGLFGSKQIEQVSQKAPHLALTVQSNSLNWGFNLAVKWPRANYIVLDEMELRLAFQERTAPIDDLVKRLHERMGSELTAVTLGHKGCLVYDGDYFTACPALADKVVDRMGAGDAFLAVTAPLAMVGAPREIIALVGNIAGGIAVGIRGHERALKLSELQKWARSILA